MLRGDRPQFQLRLQGPRRRRAAGRQGSSASATCSKAASGAPANRLRITAQLVDGVTGAHLWARQLRRRAGGRFRLSGPDHRERCHAGRAADPGGGDRTLTTGAAGKRRDLRHLLAGVDEDLLGIRRGQCGRLCAVDRGAGARAGQRRLPCACRLGARAPDLDGLAANRARTTGRNAPTWRAAGSSMRQEMQC